MARTWRRATLVAVVVLAGTVALTAPAGASSTVRRTGLPPVPELSMTLSNTGFEVPGPNPRPAGLVRFNASTADASGHLVTIFSTQPGVTLETAITEFLTSNAPDPAVALPALRDLFRDVIFHGGVKVTQGVPVGFTVFLDPGTYYVVELPIGWVPGRPPYVLRTLEVTAPIQWTRPPRIDRFVTVVPNGSTEERFVAPSQMDGDVDVLVTNLSPDPHELIVDAVVPGTTNDDLHGFFVAPASHPNPLVRSMAGLLNLSPGRWAILHLDLAPGEYALLSFIRDPDSGQAGVAEGMAQRVTLT
jgi:hypothetical protein